MSARSIRPFIGAKDFNLSREFYLKWGFSESILGSQMSVFTFEGQHFYLQKHYVKDWVDNTMVFLETSSLTAHHFSTKALQLPKFFKGVRVSEIKTLDWGREYFVHDPSGILWHIGEFTSLNETD